MINAPLIMFTLKAAVRDKLFLGAFIVVSLACALSVFFGTSASVEQNQFTAIYAAGSIRLICALALMLSVCFYVRRLAEAGQFEYLLTKPISRVSFTLSNSISFSLISAIIVLIIAIPIKILTLNIDGTVTTMWLLSIFIEMLIVTNAALFFSMTLKSSFSATLATMSFYIFGRLIGDILGVVHSGKVSGDYVLLSKIFEPISLLVPRLDLMGQSSWLIYGGYDVSSLSYIFVHGILFCLMLILATTIDLLRKEF